jgi:hypothetical protein
MFFSGPHMNNTTPKIIAIGLLSLTASLALAKGDDGQGGNGQGGYKEDHHHCRGDARQCWSAPEIDPSQALGALVLVSGAVAIVRGRRRKK